MAITITVASSRGRFLGGEKVARGSGNLGTYATSGVAVAASNFGFKKLRHLTVNPAAGIIFEWDVTNAKVIAYRQKDPGDAGGADIALPEVANAVDLSAVSFQFQAFGV